MKIDIFRYAKEPFDENDFKVEQLDTWELKDSLRTLAAEVPDKKEMLYNAVACIDKLENIHEELFREIEVHWIV